MNKTKIVCTLGPNSCDRRTIERLIAAGMNVARLNGSHNVPAWHRKVIRLVRSIDRSIPILLDLPGRKVRTQKFSISYPLKKGGQIVFVADPDYAGCDKVPVNYDSLHLDLKTGDIILADDGTLKFRVKKVAGKDVHCVILTAGELKGGKGLNVPYVKVNTPLVTKADRQLIRFARANQVDFVGLSFVESGEHVRRVKKLLGNSGIEVISKIENKYGMDKMDEIIKESAGVMVDRGDLGAETAIENIGILQKKIIRQASIYGKPVIVATEMLHSMIAKTTPTKAEVNDISNSILDGASAIMLSGETAVGIDPVQAVRTMRSVADAVEKHYRAFGGKDLAVTHRSIPNAIGKSIHEVCSDMPIDKVVCVTMSGYAARMVSRYRLDQPIIAVTDAPEKMRKLNLMWGVRGAVSRSAFKQKSVDHITAAVREIWQQGLLQRHDLIIITAAIFPKKGGRMNYLQIHRVGDLIELFKWSKE